MFSVNLARSPGIFGLGPFSFFAARDAIVFQGETQRA